MHAQVESLLDTTEDEERNHPDKTTLANEPNSNENCPDRLSQSRPEGGPGTPDAAKTEERREVVEQFERGVYVTLLLLPNGNKFFKRIKFRYAWVSLGSLPLSGNLNHMRITFLFYGNIHKLLFKGLHLSDFFLIKNYLEIEQ